MRETRELATLATESNSAHVALSRKGYSYMLQHILTKSFLDNEYKATSFAQLLGELFHMTLAPEGAELWNSGRDGKRSVKLSFVPLWTAFLTFFGYDPDDTENKKHKNPCSQSTFLGNATKVYRASYLEETPSIANITSAAKTTEHDVQVFSVVLSLFLDGRSISDANIQRELAKLRSDSKSKSKSKSKAS
jgi:hypothetical protein